MIAKRSIASNNRNRFIMSYLNSIESQHTLKGRKRLAIKFIHNCFVDLINSLPLIAKHSLHSLVSLLLCISLCILKQVNCSHWLIVFHLSFVTSFEQVKVWFQNRRTKQKRGNGLRESINDDCRSLKSNWDDRFDN